MSLANDCRIVYYQGHSFIFNFRNKQIKLVCTCLQSGRHRWFGGHGAITCRMWRRFVTTALKVDEKDKECSNAALHELLRRFISEDVGRIVDARRHDCCEI